MWSLACMTFEMLTGELLFNPRKDNNDSFGKNDDHLAQMMELLGRFPKKFTCRGLKNKKYFSKDGNLVRIPKLQNWSLKDVMIAKYSLFDSGIASRKNRPNFSRSSWVRCWTAIPNDDFSQTSCFTTLGLHHKHLRTTTCTNGFI